MGIEKEITCAERGCDAKVSPGHVRCATHIKATLGKERSRMKTAKAGIGMTTPKWVEDFTKRKTR